MCLVPESVRLLKSIFEHLCASHGAPIKNQCCQWRDAYGNHEWKSVRYVLDEKQHSDSIFNPLHIHRGTQYLCSKGSARAQGRIHNCADLSTLCDHADLIDATASGTCKYAILYIVCCQHIHIQTIQHINVLALQAILQKQCCGLNTQRSIRSNSHCCIFSNSQCSHVHNNSKRSQSLDKYSSKYEWICDREMVAPGVWLT